MILTRNMLIYFRFSRSGLKRGMKYHIFWSEIAGQGFKNRCGTPGREATISQDFWLSATNKAT